MPAFSFVHAADLHLDSPFSALHLLDPDIAARLRSATFEAYENVIDLCIEKGADFLLIAGDVYDGVDRSLRAQVRFRDGLKRLDLAGIRSFVVHGNHDPMDTWSSTLEWPEGTHIFGVQPEIVEVEKQGRLIASIEGISYPTKDERRNLSKLFDRKSDAFHIGLLHANVGSGTGHEPYAPCSLEDLKDRGMDYWALGHVHQKKILLKDHPCILYPGNTQGRNINEPGEKGCYLVEVDDARRVEATFCATDVIRWTKRDLAIQDLATEQDIIDALERACLEISEAASGRSSVARLSLTGSGPLYAFLQQPNRVPDLLETVRDMGLSFTPAVWVENILLDISPALDLEAMLNGRDFVGELLRYARDLSEHPDAEEIIGAELASLFQDPRVRRFIEPPDRRHMLRLLKKAEALCAEGLRGDRNS